VCTLLSIANNRQPTINKNRWDTHSARTQKKAFSLNFCKKIVNPSSEIPSKIPLGESARLALSRTFSQITVNYARNEVHCVEKERVGVDCLLKL
jgi:hypothetical protein